MEQTYLIYLRLLTHFAIKIRLGKSGAWERQLAHYVPRTYRQRQATDRIPVNLHYPRAGTRHSEATSI